MFDKKEMQYAGGAAFHAIDAERALLGAFMLNMSALTTMLEDEGFKLRAPHFYLARHRVLFHTMREMLNRAAGKEAAAIDPALIAHELKRMGKLAEHKTDAAGEPADDEEVSFSPDSDFVKKETLTLPYIADLASIGGADINIPAYAAMVVETAMYRNLMRQLMTMQKSINGKLKAERCSPQNIAEIVMSNAFAMEDMLRESKAETTLASLREVSEKVQREIIHRAETGFKAGLFTGFSTLDKMLGGFQPGEVTIIAARPGTGKTALACRLAAWASREYTDADGIERLPSVYFASAEMKAEQLTKRLISFKSRVDSQKCVRPELMDPRELMEVLKARESIAKYHLWIDDKADMSIIDIRASARNVWRKGQETGNPLSLIVVDYLQKIKGGGGGGKRSDVARWVEVGEVSSQLKDMAKELNVPVIALAQVNREQEKRVERKHTLADIRESGDIEQDADLVWFLENPKEGAENSFSAADRPIHIFVAKNRNGIGGFRVHFLYKPAINWFVEADNEHNRNMANFYRVVARDEPPPSPAAPAPPPAPTDGDAVDDPMGQGG